MNGAKTPDKIIVFLIYFFCLSLLFALGAWQALRGKEKSELEALVSHSGTSDINLNQWSAVNQTFRQALDYQYVAGSGNWRLDKIFLLENRVYQGQVGYEVLIPFVFSGSELDFLVNLGWIGKQQIKDTVAAIATKNSTQTLRGQVYFPEKGFTLGPSIADTDGWPIKVQSLDIDSISATAGLDLAQGVIVMESNSVSGLTKIWTPFVVNSTRHYGYAMQWWALTLLLVIFGIIWYRMSLKSKNE